MAAISSYFKRSMTQTVGFCTQSHSITIGECCGDVLHLGAYSVTQNNAKNAPKHLIFTQNPKKYFIGGEQRHPSLYLTPSSPLHPGPGYAQSLIQPLTGTQSVTHIQLLKSCKTQIKP